MNGERQQRKEARAVQLKAAILQGWEQLSPEDRAEVLVEQLRLTFEMGDDAALRQRLSVKDQETDSLHTCFPVTSFSRANLRDLLDFSAANIQLLEDQDMGEIASRLKDYYVEAGFWDELNDVAREVVSRKRQPMKGP